MTEYGVALGGGGAKGAYQIGVWKALTELDMDFKTVSGTSVGGLNGALIAQGDFNLAYKTWAGISVEKIINFNSVNGLESGKPIKSYGVVKSIIRSLCVGRLDISPLQTLIKEAIDEEKVRKSHINLGLVSYSVTDFQPVSLFIDQIPEGQLVDYLIAAACFPTFKPYKVNGKILVDGGLYDNIPISLLVEKNIKNIIAVDITDMGVRKKLDTSSLNLTYIKPSQDLGGILDFNGEKSELHIELGYCDTLKLFGKLKGKKYFLLPSEDYRKSKEKYIESLMPDDFRKMYNYLGIEWNEKPVPGNTLILYKVLDTIKGYTDSPLSGDTVLPAMAEITAEQLGISRAKKYTLNQLIGEILNQYQVITSSSEFIEYTEDLSRIIFNKSGKGLNMELRKSIEKGKFAVFYSPDLENDDEKLKVFRRFLAITFPRISIANMFISLIISKQEQSPSEAVKLI